MKPGGPHDHPGRHDRDTHAHPRREARHRPPHEAPRPQEDARASLTPFGELIAQAVRGTCSILSSEPVRCPLCGLTTTPNVLHECRQR